MKLRSIVENVIFSRFILLIILLNAILVGLETYPHIYEPNASLFTTLDRLFLAIFTIEIALKLFVYRFKLFKNGWDLFDFSIVMMSLVFYTTNLVAILRVLRVLRILRTISAFPSLRRLVNALFLAIPSMGSTLFLMLIIFYIYGIIGTSFFASVSPEYFRDLQTSLLALFQIFTLEAWASEVFRPILQEFTWSWLYFVTFILSSVFVIANLFFGELVNNAQKLSQKLGEESDEIDSQIHALQKDVNILQRQNQELHHKIDLLLNIIQKSK